MARRSVSTPRSSNWTGGFPASSFRTRRLTRSPTNSLPLRSLKLDKAQLLVKVSVRVALLCRTLHLELHAQPLAYPLADMGVDASVGFAFGPLIRK